MFLACILASYVFSLYFMNLKTKKTRSKNFVKWRPSWNNLRVWLFICLVFYVPLENVCPCGDVTIVGEGMQMKAYTRDLQLLSIVGSISCHTYCDTGPQILQSHPKDGVLYSNLLVRCKHKINMLSCRKFWNYW